MIGKSVENAAASVTPRRLVILALVEKRPGLLALPKIRLQSDDAFTHGDPVGDLAVENRDLRLEAFELANFRIVPSEDTARREQLDEHLDE